MFEYDEQGRRRKVKPTFQFRGGWTPPEVFYRLVEGDINGTDLAFLAVVDALTKCRGEGCFADNAYLARSLNISQNYVTECIAKLSGKPYGKPLPNGGRRRMKNPLLKVINTTIDGTPQRFLETVYGRAGETPPEGAGETPEGGYRFPDGGDTGNPVGGVPENLEHKDTNSKDTNRSRPPLPPRGGAAAPPGGERAYGVAVASPETQQAPQGKNAAHKKAAAATVRRNSSLLETTSTPQQDEDRRRAVKLHDALARKHKIKPGSTDTNKSARELSRLRRDVLDGDVERLDRVLDWYCEHAGEDYVPAAYCGATFAKKFIQLEAAMERSLRPKSKPPADNNGRGAPRPPAPALPRTKDGKKVLERLEERKWPVDVLDRLGDMVERSLAAYEEFCSRLADLPERHSDKLLADHILGTWATPVEFVAQWFERVHDKYADWDQWEGGNLKAVDVAGKRFTNMGRGIVQEFCGAGKDYRWYDLLTELGY